MNPSPESINIQENISLAPLTTLNVGGPARFFVRADTEARVVDALSYANARGLKVFVLGGGSNILVSDAGFDGLVIQVALKRIDESSAGESDQVSIVVGAGEDWDPFVAYCVGRGYAGIECLSGIPGYVGGTPVQNVGAYGQDVSETIVSVRCLDRKTGRIVELDNSDCGFTYRTSIFNSTERERYIVVSVAYRLVAGGPPKIAYKDLREHFGDREPTLAEVRDAVLSIRRAKSMVIDSDDPNSKSAGSFFKNPIVDLETFHEIAATVGSSVPSFPASGNMVKIPAAWLIEHAGFHKGFRLGNAGISSKHSLAIINTGDATAADILALKEKIQDSVREKFGILLQPEPVFIGFD